MNSRKLGPELSGMVGHPAGVGELAGVGRKTRREACTRSVSSAPRPRPRPRLSGYMVSGTARALTLLFG